MKGEGNIEYRPHVLIKNINTDKKKKSSIQVVSIEGRAPNSNFDSLRKAYEKNQLPLSSSPIDQSKKMDVKVYLELKRGTNPEEFIQNISEKLLNKVTHFKCYMSDLHGAVHQTPIDDLLLNCYNHWKQAYLEKLKNDVIKINDKIIEYYICSFIRDQIKNKVNNLEEILKAWKKDTSVDIFQVNEENKINKIKYIIKEEDIVDIYNNTSVKRLVEYKATLDESLDKIKSIQNELTNFDSICLNRVREIYA